MAGGARQQRNNIRRSHTFSWILGPSRQAVGEPKETTCGPRGLYLCMKYLECITGHEGSKCTDLYSAGLPKVQILHMLHEGGVWYKNS